MIDHPFVFVANDGSIRDDGDGDRATTHLRSTNHSTNGSCNLLAMIHSNNVHAVDQSHHHLSHVKQQQQQQPLSNITNESFQRPLIVADAPPGRDENEAPILQDLNNKSNDDSVTAWNILQEALSSSSSSLPDRFVQGQGFQAGILQQETVWNILPPKALVVANSPPPRRDDENEAPLQNLNSKNNDSVATWSILQEALSSSSLSLRTTTKNDAPPDHFIVQGQGFQAGILEQETGVERDHGRAPLSGDDLLWGQGSDDWLVASHGWSALQLPGLPALHELSRDHNQRVLHTDPAAHVLMTEQPSLSSIQLQFMSDAELNAWCFCAADELRRSTIDTPESELVQHMHIHSIPSWNPDPDNITQTMESDHRMPRDDLTGDEKKSSEGGKDVADAADAAADDDINHLLPFIMSLHDDEEQSNVYQTVSLEDPPGWKQTGITYASVASFGLATPCSNEDNYPPQQHDEVNHEQEFSQMEQEQSILAQDNTIHYLDDQFNALEPTPCAYECTQLSKPISFRSIEYEQLIAKALKEEGVEHAERILHYLITESHRFNSGVDRPDCFMFHKVMHAYAKLGNPSKVEYLLLIMLKECELGNTETTPNICHYTTLMYAWLKSGEAIAPYRCESILEQMYSLSDSGEFPLCKPDNFAYTTVFQCWAATSREEVNTIERTENLFQTMKRRIALGDKGLELDHFIYNVLMQIFMNQNLFGRAEELLWEMVDNFADGNHRCHPQIRSLNNIIAKFAESPNSYCDPEHIEALVRRWLGAMESIKVVDADPDKFTYSLLLKSWATSNHRDAAERLQQLTEWMRTLANEGKVDAVPSKYSVSHCVTGWLALGRCDLAAGFIEILCCDVIANKHQCLPSYHCIVKTINALCSNDRACRADKLIRLIWKVMDIIPAILVEHVVTRLIRTNNWPRARDLVFHMEDLCRADKIQELPTNRMYCLVIEAWTSHSLAHYHRINHHNTFVQRRFSAFKKWRSCRPSRPHPRHRQHSHHTQEYR